MGRKRRRIGAAGALGLGIAIWASPGPARAGEPLSLVQAVRRAQEDNPAVRESLANREAARQAKREAQLYRLPSLDGKIVGLRTDSPADVFGLQLMQERFSFGSFMTQDPNDPAPLDHFTTQLEARMPLFTGGRLSGGISQAGRMSEAAAAIHDHTRRAVSLAVTNAYLGVLEAGQLLELAEKARATTQGHVKQAQDFFDTGMIVESDLLQAQVQLAKMEENLIRARNGERLARAGLNRAMGVEQWLEFDLEAAPEFDSLSVPDLTEATQRSLDGRKDLLAMDKKAESAAAGVKRSRGEYFPQIGVGARVAWNDNRFLGGHGQSYSVMGVAEWSLWNWGQTQSRVQRSKSESRAAGEAARAYRQGVEFEVRQSLDAVAEARARRDVARGAVAAAEKALVILDDRFQQGVARVTDLLDAETLAHEARVRAAQARFDLQRSVRTLNFAIGGEPVPEVEQ